MENEMGMWVTSKESFHSARDARRLRGGNSVSKASLHGVKCCTNKCCMISIEGRFFGHFDHVTWAVEWEVGGESTVAFLSKGD